MSAPTNTNPKLSPLPKMPGDTGYGLGFFCGCLVGAVGTYLAFTPEGKQLKQKILKEFQSNQQAIMLEQVLSSDKSAPVPPLLASVKEILTALRYRLNPGVVAKFTPKISDKDTSSKRKHYFKKK